MSYIGHFVFVLTVDGQSGNLGLSYSVAKRQSHTHRFSLMGRPSPAANATAERFFGINTMYE